MLQQPLWGIPPIGAIDSSTPEPAMRCHNSLPYTGLCPHKTVTTAVTDRVKMHNVRRDSKDSWQMFDWWNHIFLFHILNSDRSSVCYHVPRYIISRIWLLCTSPHQDTIPYPPTHFLLCWISKYGICVAKFCKYSIFLQKFVNTRSLIASKDLLDS